MVYSWYGLFTDLLLSARISLWFVDLGAQLSFPSHLTEFGHHMLILRRWKYFLNGNIHFTLLLLFLLNLTETATLTYQNTFQCCPSSEAGKQNPTLSQSFRINQYMLLFAPTLRIWFNTTVNGPFTLIQKSITYVDLNSSLIELLGVFGL